MLRFGPRRGEENSRIRVCLPNPKGGVMYLLRMEIKLPLEADLDPSDQPPSLSGWLAHAVKGKNPLGPTKLVESRRGDTWLKRQWRLFSCTDASAIYVLMAWDGKRGAALTRRWELIEEPVAASEGRVVLQTLSGDWAEMPHEPQPAAPSQPTLWAPADPDALRKTSRPAEKDIGRPLELAGAPGEMCVAAVALFTPQTFSAVRLALSDLAGESGKLGAEPTWKRIVFHPRRTDYYGRGKTFSYVPDFFISRPNGADCPAGETSGFWVNLRLPADAKPGLYQGALQAGQLTLPVRVRVYPLRLADLVGRTRHLFLDTGRWRRMSDELVLEELADVVGHGYQSITLASRGTAAVENGRVTKFELSEESVRGVRLTLKAGLTGPLLFWSGWLVDDLSRELQIDPQTIRVKKADTWPPELATAVADTLKLMKPELAKLGVADPVHVLVDEPGYWKEGSPERMLWDVKVSRLAGWRTFCTSSEPPTDPIGQGLDYHCYGGSRLFLEPRYAAWLANETRAAGQKLWYYCTGAYSGQIGNMVRNRFLAGFFFARVGADGTASWTFQRPRGNAFDDFGLDERAGEPLTGQACITYPDPEHPGRHLDTLQWEGLRQAWYDHRYVETLRQAIAAARLRDSPAAARAAARLNSLLDQLPWNGEPFLDPQTTNARLSELRSAIAAEIISLHPVVAYAVREMRECRARCAITRTGSHAARPRWGSPAQQGVVHWPTGGRISPILPAWPAAGRALLRLPP